MNPTKQQRWSAELVVFQLLDDMKMRASHAARLYRALQCRFEDLEAAVENDQSWPIHLVDRRYAAWPDCGDMLDITDDRIVRRAEVTRPIESLVYDLAELVRRKRKGGADAEGDPGGVAEAGVR